MDGDNITALVNDLSSRLTAITDEFTRRARTIASAPAGAGPGEVARGETGADADPDVALARVAHLLLDQRRARTRFLPAELFHEPAWDMMLSLFVARHERRTMNVKTLVACSDAPVTTAQRWIDHLHKLGLIERAADPVDRRRIEVQLSPAGDKALRGLLGSLA